MRKTKTGKRILSWLLAMVLLAVTLVPAEAATYREVLVLEQDGYSLSLLKSAYDINQKIFIGGFEIGEYCFVDVGQRIAPWYSGHGFTDYRYATASGSAISIHEHMEQLQNAGMKLRTTLPKKPSELHMAPNPGIRWIFELVNPVFFDYLDPYGNNVEQTVSVYQIYPTIPYYGVVFDLNGGNWNPDVSWVGTAFGGTENENEYGIWKPTTAQNDEDGNLFTNNIHFAYAGLETELPVLTDVSKDGYELRGWGVATGGAIELTPGSDYTVTATHAQYSNDWGQKNILIQALWVPKNIGTQSVTQSTPGSASFSTTYDAYYTLTDKGFLYKKSNETTWTDMDAVAQDGQLTASVTDLEPGASYEVKGYFENQTGRVENDAVIFTTYRTQSAGNVSVSGISLHTAVFTANYVCDDPAMTAAFQYKKATESQWLALPAIVDDAIGSMTVTASNLEEDTAYQVKAALSTPFGTSQSQTAAGFTTLRNNSGEAGAGGSPVTTPTPTSTSSPTPTPVPLVTTVTASTGTASPGVTATTTVDAISDASGNATATVTESQVTEAVTDAVAAAITQGEGTSISVEIKVEAPMDSKTVETRLPREAFHALQDNKAEALTTSTPIAAITFDKATIEGISMEATADVSISAVKVSVTDYSEAVKTTVGDRPVYDFRVSSGNKSLSPFGGTVTVSVPYTPKEDEDANAILIYYISDEGDLEIVKDCFFDKETGRITFTTTHFSTFAVGYNKVAFTDVPPTAWFSDAVSYVAARGITDGTGNGKFSPDASLTRGQVLVMAMRAYELAPAAPGAENFSDAGNTYYTDYLAAARALGITSGIGDNRFDPEKVVTRQEMAVLLYNMLKQTGKVPAETPEQTMSAYLDAEKPAEWARKAMNCFVQAGIVSGDGTHLNPRGITSRAQMAQILLNLLSK